MLQTFVLFSILALFPATRPTTQPTTDQLRDEIKSLRAEVDRLKADNTELRHKLFLATKAHKPAAADTDPIAKQTRDFKPGMYKIFNADGRTYVEKHCDTMEDALRYASNLRWKMQVIYDPDTGAPIYPGVIRTGDD